MMNPTKIVEKEGKKKRGLLRKSNLAGVNLIKVDYI
jgi:hypothetical protein